MNLFVKYLFMGFYIKFYAVLAWYINTYFCNHFQRSDTLFFPGSLAVLLHRIDNCPESWPIDGASLQEIRELQALAETISDKALPLIQYSNPLYYSRKLHLQKCILYLCDSSSQ